MRGTCRPYLFAAVALMLAPAAAAAAAETECFFDQDNPMGLYSFLLQPIEADEWSIMWRFGPSAARQLAAGDTAGAPRVYALHDHPDRYTGLLSVFDDGRFIMTLHERYRAETPDAVTSTGHCTTADN